MSQAAIITPASAKKRLFGLLAVFFALLTLPIYLLVDRVYLQLSNESYYAAREGAVQWIGRIDESIESLLQKEQERPIADYSFFNVLENPLLQASGLKFSPLSEVPPQTDIAGLIGYFQIDADGAFRIPALPETASNAPSTWSGDEFAKRQALKSTLQKLLTAETANAPKTNLSANLPEVRAEEKDKQQYVVGAMEDLSPKRAWPSSSRAKAERVLDAELKQRRIDSRQWEREQEKKSYPAKGKADDSEYKLRKETVRLPEQTLSDSLMNNLRGRSAASPPAVTKNETKGEVVDSVVLRSVQTPNAAIISFESEVSPLQVLNLQSGHLCFYRNVWHNKTRYVQGFVVSSDAFWRAALQTQFEKSIYSSVLIIQQGQLLWQTNRPMLRPETLLYRTTLSPPMQNFEVIVNSTGVGLSPGKRLIDLLVIALVLILSGGVLLFYRLGAKQIDLTRQQQNFISAVSHELKTPLTSIRMYGEMLRSEWVIDEGKKKSYYDYIFLESERLSRLITNVLQLAKLQNGKQDLTLTAIKPEILLKRSRDKISAQIEASGFQLASELPETLREKPISVVEDAFYQIVINLVDNAVKFAGNAENKTLQMGFRGGSGKNEIVFFVRDFGPGIKKEQLRKIFTLFYRAGDELTRTRPGTGIGLALAKQLAESMGARLNVENRHPGAEFRLTLKRAL